MINFDQIVISPEAFERAAAADLDLLALRDEQAEQFMMFLAETLIEVAADLKAYASDVFFAAFPHHKLFELKADSGAILKVFPALLEKEQDKYLDALGRLVDHPKFAFPMAYVRTVADEDGKKQQFALPIVPENWQGESNYLIGPFDSELLAKTWLSKQNDRQGDCLIYADKWFCDVFS